MTEREVQAQLHPHTGQVEVSGQDLHERLARQAEDTAETLALIRACRTLQVISEEDNLAACLAKNTLDDIRALMATPAPNLRPFSTYDHAGSEY